MSQADPDSSSPGLGRGRGRLEKRGGKEEVSEKGKNEKELGIVVSQADPDSSSPGQGRGCVF